LVEKTAEESLEVRSTYAFLAIILIVVLNIVSIIVYSIYLGNPASYMYP